jgi:hypothetical protein
MRQTISMEDPETLETLAELRELGESMAEPWYAALSEVERLSLLLADWGDC